MARHAIYGSMTAAAAIVFAFSAYAQQQGETVSTDIVTTTHAQFGDYLTDGTGRALYMFEADQKGSGGTSAVSNCYDECAAGGRPW